MMYGTVRTTERLTPNLVRVVLGGDGLRDFQPSEATDAYVNVAIPPDGAPYTAPFDLEEVQANLEPDLRPYRRRYTVRRWDDATRELTLEFVVHGADGIGGPWAMAARPGDALVFTGPGGSYRPDPEVGVHLLVGDESALPAIAASLEALPSDALAVVRILVDGPDHELTLTSPGRIDLRWLHRTGDDDTDQHLLAAEVEALELPAGRVQAFVHGEAEEIRAIRKHLLLDRDLPRADVSCSPYWRRHLTDERWREIKRAWSIEAERDVA